MTTLTYPVNADLQLIAQQKLPVLTMDDPVFGICPVTTQDSAVLIFEQWDNYTGLMQVRGLDGMPPAVKKVGFKQYTMTPGVYGEFLSVSETEMVERRAPGTFNQAIDLTDIVAQLQDQLLTRQIQRIKQVIWTLLATGTFSISGADGAIMHTDSYTTRTFSASVPWSTFATGTPLNDFRQIQLFGRGYSVNFGRQATAYMNQATLNNMLNNTNSADLYGRRVQGLATANSLDGVNSLLAMDGLPTIVVYDDGYIDDTNTFQLYIPNNKVIVVGKRTNGDKVMDFAMTRNANNANFNPGPYTKIVDNGEDAPPRQVQVHAGFNGGPRVWYPSAIAVMSV